MKRKKLNRKKQKVIQMPEINIKTCVLDWATVSSSGDISKDDIYAPGDIQFYDMTLSEQTVSRIGDCSAILCNKTRITADVIKMCPSLRYVGLFATGFNNIDLEAADAAGITVCNAGSYSTDAVAQLTFSMILTHFTNIISYSDAVRNGAWITSPTFSMLSYPMKELSGKTIAIVGFGSIGKAVAKIADAFNMNVIISTRTVPHNSQYKFVSIEEAFSQADVITFHCPLTPQTHHMVNSNNISLMKNDAVIVNTSRGGVVDEYALASALDCGRIAGAYLDVLDSEPMSASSPLAHAKNCLITPHIAWAPLETRQRLISIVNDNFRAFLGGNPTNVVNKPHK